jgi:phage terminase Nu1 subunit (DNA packaging protein)
VKPKKHVSEREFATLVGASLSTVQRRRAADRLPMSATQDADGRWRIDPVLGREEWGALGPPRVGESGDASSLEAYRKARARREAAEAQLAEDEVAKNRGTLISAAGVEARLIAVFASCRTKLLGVPSKLKQHQPDLSRAQLAAVEELVLEALEDLADGRTNP